MGLYGLVLISGWYLICGWHRVCGWDLVSRDPGLLLIELGPFRSRWHVDVIAYPTASPRFIGGNIIAVLFGEFRLSIELPAGASSGQRETEQGEPNPARCSKRHNKLLI